MNVTFTIGLDVSVDIPIHPLDLSMAIPTEPGGSTCLGALQASDTPMSQGDLILGAAFMRNIYTVLSYESDPPKLGILPLNNASTAYSEFNTVRVQHQQLGSGLSSSQSQNGGASEGTSGGAMQSDGKSNHLALKILAGVGAFVLIAGALLCFGLWRVRRRAARTPIPEVKDAREMEISYGREKRNLAGKSVFGLEVEEAFTMFSAKATSKDGDVESIGSPVQHFQPATPIVGADYDEDPETAGLSPASRVHRRPRLHQPYESVDHEWGSGSMAGLMKDGSRFPSVYSVNSFASKGSELTTNPPPVRHAEAHAQALPVLPPPPQVHVKAEDGVRSPPPPGLSSPELVDYGTPKVL